MEESIGAAVVMASPMATGTPSQSGTQQGAVKRMHRCPKWPAQGETSWRGRTQLRTTLFTSRDGWDSSVGWL